MGHGIVYLGILAILAALSTWLLSTVESSLRDEAVPHTEAPPLYMDHFLATRMNAQGTREYTLASPHMVQLPDRQGTRLEQPEMTVFKDQITTWMIHAEHAWIAPDDELIRLEQAVSIERPASSGKPPMTITTRNLLLRPEQGIAETIEPARMETPGGLVTAEGLKAYLHTEQLELLSKVRGIHEPSTP